MKWKNNALLLLVLLISKLSAISESNDSTRFTSISFNHQTILQDNYTKLEWVNGKENNLSKSDSNQSIKDGCIRFNVSSENNNIMIRDKAKEYCKNLDFASYHDWRIPKDKEYQELIIAINKESISLHYVSPSCTNALGEDDNQLLHIIKTTDNGNEIGEIAPFTKDNITTCLRCVRDAEAPLTP